MKFDIFDTGDPMYPPRFLCDSGCNSQMTPIHYVGDQGYTYVTDTKTGDCQTIPNSKK